MIVKNFFFILIIGCCFEIYFKGWKIRKRVKKFEKRDRYYEKFIL